MKTLEDLTSQTGVEVLDHLQLDVEVPIIGGLQAQGDLFIIPLRLVSPALTLDRAAEWVNVPGDGIEVLRGAAGGNPHVLVADPGICRWTTGVRDATGLALGVFHADKPVYLLHPEHGASGVAPGEYVIRRQREQAQEQRLVAD